MRNRLPVLCRICI